MLRGFPACVKRQSEPARVPLQECSIFRTFASAPCAAIDRRTAGPVEAIGTPASIEPRSAPGSSLPPGIDQSHPAVRKTGHIARGQACSIHCADGSDLCVKLRDRSTLPEPRACNYRECPGGLLLEAEDVTGEDNSEHFLGARPQGGAAF